MATKYRQLQAEKCSERGKKSTACTSVLVIDDQTPSRLFEVLEAPTILVALFLRYGAQVSMILPLRGQLIPPKERRCRKPQIKGRSQDRPASFLVFPWVRADDHLANYLPTWVWSFPRTVKDSFLHAGQYHHAKGILREGIAPAAKDSSPIFGDCTDLLTAVS